MSKLYEVVTMIPRKDIVRASSIDQAARLGKTVVQSFSEKDSSPPAFLQSVQLIGNTK